MCVQRQAETNTMVFSLAAEEGFGETGEEFFRKVSIPGQINPHFVSHNRIVPFVYQSLYDLRS
jgi:hypothetical protein